MNRESILNVFPDQTGVNRLVIAVEQADGEPSRLVLRQESQSENVGWFVQSRVVIEPEQVAGLKMTLTSRSTGHAVKSLVDAGSPTVLSFSEAAAAAS